MLALPQANVKPSGPWPTLNHKPGTLLGPMMGAPSGVVLGSGSLTLGPSTVASTASALQTGLSPIAWAALLADTQWPLALLYALGTGVVSTALALGIIFSASG